MLATPRNSITARDPEATLLNRAAATLADAGEARRLDIARAHEDSVNIRTSIGDTVEPNSQAFKKFYKNVVGTNPTNSQQLKGDCMFCIVLCSIGSFMERKGCNGLSTLG